ncbi:MAG: proteasome assembly chaperone family protein [Methanomassiliicoccus sp.]|nr:proteasome assembly chaperone family protein [Methanomassiliicoccus sp.]
MEGRMSMKDGLAVHEYKAGKYEDAMMIVGFPSVGLVSSIAANFIIRTSKLERVAGITSKEFPPYALIHDGVPSPPVRIYAGERTCGDGGEQCRQIVTAAGEFMPRPEMVMPLADALLDFCKEKGIRTVVTLEGIGWQSAEEPKIMGVGGTERGRELLGKYGIEKMTDGMVGGIAGVLLYGGELRDIDVICLLGPARADLPDARGSAKLLEVVARMLPELRIDPEPLYKEAEEIEKQIKMAMESVNRPKKMTPEEAVIYG